MLKQIEIFRPGTFTSSNGVRRAYTLEELRACAGAYDPVTFAAPAVIGHPRTEDPAFGWVQKLEVDGEGKLLAHLDELDPSFTEMVDAGRFRKVSASFYLPEHPANPKPGTLYLKHVGFLGAAAPAVKGLRPITAEHAEVDALTAEFADLDEWDIRNLAGLFRRLRDWIAGKFTLEEADQALSSFDIDTLLAAALRPSPTSGSQVYSEAPAPMGGTMSNPHTPPTDGPPPAATGQSPASAPTQDPEALLAELQRREETLSQKEAALSAKESELTDKEAALKAAEHAEFAEGLVKEGKLPPVHKAGLVSFLSTLRNEYSVSFAEGDETQTTPSLDWFKSFLSSLPKAVSFGEFAKGNPPGAQVAEFAAPAGFECTPESMAQYQEVEAYAQTHQVDFMTALRAVTGGK